MRRFLSLNLGKDRMHDLSAATLVAGTGAAALR
jgi:hypothetical protein